MLLGESVINDSLDIYLLNIWSHLKLTPSSDQGKLISVPKAKLRTKDHVIGQ